jgi:hypothetical protein
MHDTMKKPRYKTPSSAERARRASGADEGGRQYHPQTARSAPTHPPRGGRLNTNFNLSEKLEAVQRPPGTNTSLGALETRPAIPRGWHSEPETNPY